jgi:hypothetical protein
VRTERARLVNLVTLVVAVAAIALFLRGPAFWLGSLLVVGATAFGAFSVLADLDPRGVPLESLAAPSVAAFATVGLAHLGGPTLAGLLSLALGGGLVGVSLFMEARLLLSTEIAQGRRQQQSLPLVVLLAFLSFVAIAGAIDGGSGHSVLPALPSRGAALALLASADALVAFVLGYRLAAFRSASVRQATWSAGTYAVVIAVTAGFARAISLPGLLGPALLAAVFYLWSAYRSASGAERRSSGWLTEYLALAGAAILAVAWNLLLR